MRKKKILIPALITFIVLLFLIAFKSFIIKSYHHITLGADIKKYPSLYKEIISSQNYQIKRLVKKSLYRFDGIASKILFDQSQNHYIIKTDELENAEHQLWKINQHGEMIDSITISDPALLGFYLQSNCHPGVYFFKEKYLDWGTSGNKALNDYDQMVDGDQFSEEDFKNYYNKSTWVEYVKDYENDLGICFMHIDGKWILIKSKELFSTVIEDYQNGFKYIHPTFHSKPEFAQGLKNSITPFYDWSDKNKFIHKVGFLPQSYRSSSFYDINNTSRSGWNGLGYFRLNHKGEDLHFKADGFQYTSLFGYLFSGFYPNIGAYAPTENSDLLFIEIETFAQYGGRNPKEIGLYVIRRNE